MAILRAVVNKPTGRTRHFLGSLGATGLEAREQFPTAATVEIEPEESGFLLLRFDAEGEFCGDTWHQSLEQAKEQARFEFGILDSDWMARS